MVYFEKKGGYMLVVILHHHAYDLEVLVKSEEEARETVAQWREKMKKHYPYKEFTAKLLHVSKAEDL